MKMLAKSVCFVICCISCLHAIGQACCSGGNPLSSNLGIQSLSNGNVQFQLSYDFNVQESLVDGSSRLDDNLRKRTTDAVLLRASTALGSKWGVSILLSWIHQGDDNYVPATMMTNKVDVNGIGDMLVFTQYQLINKNNSGLSIAGGLKIPLGENEIVDDSGISYNPDLQPGSGSWDFIAAYSYLRDHTFLDNLTFISRGSYRISTEDKRFNGQQPFRFGNELQIFNGFKYQFLFLKQVVEPFWLAKVRKTQPNESFGTDESNTGGFWLDGVIGADWRMSDNFGLGLRMELPLYRSLEGTQLTMSKRFRISLLYNLPTRQKAHQSSELNTFSN